ncbi:hypothetical protein CBU02nite_14310 [Clostridium butyricum]|uniref:Glycosyl transferase family 2 n=1 Tax=Clostridium butyricum TaxID=1492 RepID=A0A512TL35_CLOBU|nr:hypothetical protein [Clostridium butyricum]NOW24163.1 GT2 family glycosyltransferase [Clostridium butyricum]GEQ20925.1 hypothetical protein CBU02nite_14310 [Clostridium butyricum]
MYKCEVVEIDSKDIIDDKEYYYNYQERKQIINESAGTYSLKLIKKIELNNKNDVTLKQMKALNLKKMNHVQCCCKDKKHKDMFDYLDEKFEVAFNDIDLCLKVRKLEYLNVWTPYARAYHYESVSRGYEDTPEKQERFTGEINRFKEKWISELESGDPYYNVNLSLNKEDFSLR